MREIAVERYLKKKVAAAGGLCLKFVSPGYRGVPDRIVLTGVGDALFVELKAPGKKLSEHQKRMHKILLNLGCSVVTIGSKEAVDDFISVYMRGET